MTRFANLSGFFIAVLYPYLQTESEAGSAEFATAKRMMNALVNWLLSALSLMIVAHVIRGFDSPVLERLSSLRLRLGW